MSHETVLADLGALIKHRVTAFDPKAHVQHIMGESDRAFIILHSATLEDFLLAHLEDVMPDINSDERSRLFSFEGPAGSFASRIRLAQGLGLVSRQGRGKPRDDQGYAKCSSSCPRSAGLRHARDQASNRILLSTSASNRGGVMAKGGRTRGFWSVLHALSARDRCECGGGRYGSLRGGEEEAGRAATIAHKSPG